MNMVITSTSRAFAGRRYLRSGICLVAACMLWPLSPAAQQSQAVPVNVVPAVESELSPVRWVPATIIGRNDARIAAEVEGRLEELLDVGDSVAAGGTIARIDATTIRLDVSAAGAEVAALQAKLDYYRRESERLGSLARQNNAAKNSLDAVISDLEETQGRLSAARSRVALAEEQLRRTVIKAPFDGVVTERLHSPGERVEIGDEIVRLVDTSRLEIQARIPQESTAFIQPGSELEVRDGTSSGVARVRVIVPVGDSISRLHELRLSYDHPGWMAGQAVRIGVPHAAKRRVTAVPRDALVIRGDGTSIYKINGDNTARSVNVQVGIAQDALVEVIGDVMPGDRVVTRGNERLRPGQAVRILSESPPL